MDIRAHIKAVKKNNSNNMELPRMELKSVSGSQLNLDALYQLCPSCFTEVRDEKSGG